MIAVACDVCGQKYELADSYYGKGQRCKECDNRFEVSDKNAAVDAPSDDEEGESVWAKTFRILRGTASGLAIIVTCAWMISLLFRDPRVRPVATTPSSSRSFQPIVSPPNVGFGARATLPSQDNAMSEFRLRQEEMLRRQQEQANQLNSDPRLPTPRFPPRRRFP